MAHRAIPPPNEEKAFQKLADIIEVLPRFSLVFAICASDTAAIEHIDRFQRKFPDVRISHVKLDWPDVRLPALLDDVYNREKPQILFVTGMEAWTDRAENAPGNEFTMALNVGRDYLHDNVSCPVVFWCTLPVYNFIRRNAPDFFSIATDTLQFSLFESYTLSSIDNPITLEASQALTVAEREARITELTERIGRLCSQPNQENHKEELIRILYNIAILKFSSGKLNDARDYIQRAITIAKTIYPKNSLTIASFVHLLASIEKAIGNNFEARDMLRDALEIQESVLGNMHRNVAATLYELAEVERIIGSYDLSKDLYLRALTILESSIGQRSIEVAAVLGSLGSLECSAGHLSESETFYEQALEIDEVTVGRNHPNTAITMSNLANVAVLKKNFAEAKTLYEQALKILETRVGRNHRETAVTLHNMARMYFTLKDFVNAQALAEQALAIKEAMLGNTHPDTKNTYRLLEGIYTVQGDTKRAKEMAAKAAIEGAPATETLIAA